MTKLAFGIIIVFLLISLIVLACAIIIKLYIQKIKKYNQIIYQKEIEHQVKLNQSILETQEQTLNEIAQELHDDAGQQITYINFQLENLKLDFPAILENINLVSSSVTSLSNSIRQLSHSLNNQVLSQQDLIKAIEIEAERLNQNKKIKIHFINKINTAITFSTHEKIVIYRIFQECLNNILKHAGATEIKIKLEKNKNFSLSITDNGKGFDFNQEIQNSKSNGLQNILSRAKVIGYKIFIQTELNQGTTILLESN